MDKDQEVVIHQSLYSTIRAVLKQLIYFVNFVFLKLIRGPGDELDDKTGSKVVNPGSDKSQNKVRKLKGIKDIPGPRSLPFIGTLLTSPALESTELLKSNEERMRKYGPIVKEELYWNFPMIIVMEPDDIERLSMELGVFRPGLEIISFYRSLRKDRYDTPGIVNANGPDWLRLHKAAVPFIASTKYIRSITTESDKIAMDFSRILEEAGPVVQNFDGLLRNFVAETSLLTVFGRRMGMMDDAHVELKVLFDVHEEYWEAFHQSAYGYPWWKYFSTNVWKRFVKAEDEMFEKISITMNKLKEDGDIGGVLPGILKSSDLTENEKLLIILEFITGGSEPVFSFAILLLYFLSRDKRIADKIYEELKEVLPTKLSPLDEGALDRLPYLNACLMETHRMCPITPMVARLTEQPVQIGDYELPPYTLVTLQTQYANHLEKSFYKAKEFLPERWIYKDGVPPFSPHRRNLLLSFGIGTRICPGRRAATLHLKVLLARLFRKYEIQFEKELEIEFKWMNNPKLPINIGFHERVEDDCN